MKEPISVGVKLENIYFLLKSQTSILGTKCNFLSINHVDFLTRFVILINNVQQNSLLLQKKYENIFKIKQNICSK